MFVIMDSIKTGKLGLMMEMNIAYSNIFFGQGCNGNIQSLTFHLLMFLYFLETLIATSFSSVAEKVVGDPGVSVITTMTEGSTADGHVYIHDRNVMFDDIIPLCYRLLTS